MSGNNPDEDLVVIKPRPGELLINDDDIINKIRELGKNLANAPAYAIFKVTSYNWSFCQELNTQTVKLLISQMLLSRHIRSVPMLDSTWLLLLVTWN